MVARWLALAAAAIVLSAAPARAQAGRVEVAGGGRWIGAIRFGEVDAEETAPGGARRTLFHTSTDLDRSLGGEVRVSVNLAALVQVEGAIALSRPQLTTRVTSDLEGAPDTMAAEPLTQYLFEGGALLQLSRWRAGRLAPFAAAGAGYVRQLHDRRTLADTGKSYYVGGGVRYVLSSRGAGWIKSAGLRGDIRATFTSLDVAPDNSMRTAPALSASFFVRF